MSYYCEACNFTTDRGYDFRRHMRSSKHLKRAEATPVDIAQPEPEPEIEPQPAFEPDIDSMDLNLDSIMKEINSENLKPLKTVSFDSSATPTMSSAKPKRAKKPRTTSDYDDIKALMGSSVSLPQAKPAKTIKKKEHDDYAALYDSTPTKKLGEKRFLLEKLNQYKQLFPEELKGFKIKANATEEELQEYIKECDNIISCKSVHQFLQVSILNAIRVVEEVSYQVDNVKLPFTSATLKTNIRGTADMLQQNPEFNRLCKLLFIKYNVFDNIPPEFQMIFLISSTALYCRHKNANEEKINNILNQSL